MISGSAPQSEASYGKVLCIPKKDLRPLGKIYKWAPLCHWPKISPIKEIESRLKDLQLLHFTNVGHTNLDQSLLRAMARFWRPPWPETHSFHFSVGEMTVTLEDVAFLFGLPTTGKVVSSPMKVDPKKLVLQFLAKKDPVTKSPLADSIAGAFTETKDGLTYYVRISWLRKQCKNGLGMNATEEEKDRFTRLYCLLLFGTSLFPSSTKGAVPAFLLELLEGDLNERKDYNWGAAVLAYLYHALDCAAMNIPKKNIPGPWLLLQLWSWTRFPTCRPEMISLLDLSKESVPYGRKWMGKRKYNFPHRSGICYAREVFLKLGEHNIEWRPYEKVFQYMPQLVQATPADCFRTTLPCIFYWKVAIYYPNRVMRQFGLYQKIPEVPMNWEEMKTYFEQKRTASTGLTTLHKDFCKRWLEMKEGDKVDETRPWTSDNMSDYLRWYRLCCGGKIIVPGHVTNKPASQQHYIHQADVSMAHVKNDLKLAIYGIKLVEDGLPNVGKAILRLAKSNLDLEPASKCKLEHLLQARGLSSDFEEIEDETSSPTDILPDAYEAIISKGGNIKFDMLEKYLGPPTQIARVLLNRVPNELGPADSNHQFEDQKQAPYHAPGYQQEQPPHNALRRASPKDSNATSSEEDTDAMEEPSEPQLEQTPNYRRASPDDNNASGPVQKEESDTRAMKDDSREWQFSKPTHSTSVQPEYTSGPVQEEEPLELSSEDTNATSNEKEDTDTLQPEPTAIAHYKGKCKRQSVMKFTVGENNPHWTSRLPELQEKKKTFRRLKRKREDPGLKEISAPSQDRAKLRVYYRKRRHLVRSAGTNGTMVHAKYNGTCVSNPAKKPNDHAEKLYVFSESEFYKFNMCRTCNKFQQGNTWALYSDLDTFPKYYGLICKVEHEPFQVHINWLEACPKSDVERAWLDANLPISCGKFRVTTQSRTYDKPDYFSHMVSVRHHDKGNYYEILPDVGEVWAIYKNWSAGWTAGDFKTSKFDIVEIIENRIESRIVGPLRQVPEYTSVFMLEEVDGSSGAWEVPASTYILFSHKIPAIRLTDECGGKLKGFWELDPASVP